MDENLDLLGDPIPENWGKRGRPPHIPTQRNRNKIRMLLGLGWDDRQIARALRITIATLRKHYFHELRSREEARPALEAVHLMRIYDAAQGGNVGAMKELGRVTRGEAHPDVAMVPSGGGTTDPNSKSHRGYSPTALHNWYREYVVEQQAAGNEPSRNDDCVAARRALGDHVPRDAVREARRKFAPPQWKSQGRRRMRGETGNK